MRKILVFAPFYPPAYKGGGPIRTLEALVLSSPKEYDVNVMTRNVDLGETRPLDVQADEWVVQDRAKIWYASSSAVIKRLVALRTLGRERADLLYVNSFFNFQMSVVPQLMRAVGLIRAEVLLLAPRGEFGAGALSSKAVKKRVFVALYRFCGLHRQVVWHVSSLVEEMDVRQVWGERARVVVRQNDTLLPRLSDRSGIPARREQKALALVSIGRIVEHKGLHLVLEGLRGADYEVELDVFGPAEDAAYLAACTSAVDSLPENVRVRFHDPLPHDEVRDTLRRHDALVMPTAGENFGHIIAEALSVACPVICSDTTPWTSVLRGGGGFVVEERKSLAWSLALREYASAVIRDQQRLRVAAADAYDMWQASTAQAHVFDLVLE